MIRRRLFALVALVIIWIPGQLIIGKPASKHAYEDSSKTISIGNLLDWDLDRRLRFSAIVGSQAVDGPYEEATAVYAASVHWRLIFHESLYGNLVLEASFARGKKHFEFKLDENESIFLRGTNSTTTSLNFEVIGITWQSHNPLKILPYTTFGIGFVTRPGKEIETTYYSDNPDIPESERRQEVVVKMEDCGKNAGSINLGAGLQVYYLCRLDFRVFLIKPGRVALYRLGIALTF
ncbi:hypothetical protein JXJ21_14375 [candidate division KSB1 bacterium]|nr:hypothetical protein [candidate division KSB1 bacterium]